MMHRRTYLRTVVAGGAVAAGVGMDALDTGVVQTAQAQTDTTWSQQAKLTAADGDDGDEFGSDVAVSGDGRTAVIGAQFDEDPDEAGSAYVFSQDGDSWSQQAKLAPEDGNNDFARFGEFAAMSRDGTTAVIAAPSDDEPNGSNAGSAYVFSQDGDSWSQEAKLAAEDGDETDRFGTSVSVSNDGTTAVIGAQGDEDPNGKEDGLFAGSAYVFSQDEDAWNQQAKLVPDDGDKKDSFGDNALSGDGTTAVIGASRDDNPNGTDAGSAYVFSQDGDAWSQQVKLTADDGDDDDGFGEFVALSRDGATAVITAPGDEDADGAGSAYVFSQDGDSWSQEAKLTAADSDDDGFGNNALSEDGTTAVIGVPGDDEPNGPNAGSAYVFSQDSDTWTQQAKLAAADGDDGDLFGVSVSVSNSGTTAVISAAFDEDPNGENAGSAYVFTSSSGSDENSAIDEYDDDDSGTIDDGELLDALADYPEQLNDTELLELLSVYEP